MSEKTIDANKIFPGGSVINNTEAAKKAVETTRNESFDSKKPVEMFMGTEDLGSYYKRTFEAEEQTKQIQAETDKIIDNIFDDFDGFEAEVATEELREPLIETKENFVEELFTNKKELLDEIDKVSDEEIEADLNLEINAKIKAMCENENYPIGYPTFEEVLKLKKLHKNLFFIFSTSLYEAYQYSIDPKLFICTTFKSVDYLDFKTKFNNEEPALLYPYVVTKCCLFPKIDYDEIFELSAGVLKKIAENVLINSDYKTSLEVIKF